MCHSRPYADGHLGPASTGIDAEVAAEYYTSAMLGLLIWWVDHDFREGPAWLARIYRTLAQPARSASASL